MRAEPAIRTALRRLGTKSVHGTCAAYLVISLAISQPAHAFPLIDPTNVGNGAGVTDLAAPDAQDLTHQLQIANGLPDFGTSPGWSFTPRLGIQETFTDNIMQVHSPRRWDFTTAVSPDFLLSGNTQRVQMRFDYAPVLIVNARTGSQNALNQQLNGSATVTAIDDLAFVDVRALSGIQSTRGAAGAGGTIGAGEGGGLTAGSGVGLGGVGQNGSGRQDSLQTVSVGISPYLLKQFGDIGTVKLGYSVNLSQSSSINGFNYLPFPTGRGGRSQNLMTTEQTARYTSGDFLDDFQNVFNLDFSQSTSTGQVGTATGTGSILASSAATRSSRQILSDSLNYALSRSITLTATLGHEQITYSGSNGLAVNDLTWSVGGTYTPNLNSSLTISYGHQEGEETITFSGRYQLSARTAITASYSDTLGTQLENLQRQLNQGAVNSSGSFVNAQTGGQLFGSTNAAPVQPGVFHFKTLTSTITTQLNRDTVSLTLNTSNQVSAGGTSAVQASTQTNGLSIQWTHDLKPDLRLVTSSSYNAINGGIAGSSQSIAFNTSLIYTLSQSLSASARYSFFKSSSQTAAQNLYDDIFVLGILKSF